MAHGLASTEFQIAARLITTDQELAFATATQGGADFKRMISCWIVAALPDDGVDEALGSLGDIFEFHYRRGQIAGPPVMRTVYREDRVTGKSIRPGIELQE
jgi:hypothetical protein